MVILGGGVLMWLRSRYILFRLSVNMYVPSEYFSVLWNMK